MICAAVKPTEDSGLLRFGNTFAAVADIDRGKQGVFRGVQGHLPSFGGVFHGIVQQVENGFFRPFRVKQCFGVVFFYGQIDVFGFRLVLELIRRGPKVLIPNGRTDLREQDTLVMIET